MNGFSGWLMPTSDMDWRKKWETPSATTPQFTEARTVTVGQRISVLTLFSNPQLRRGAADITCDLEIVRPNGIADRHADVVCYRGPIHEDARHVFLSSQVVEFVGEKDDPKGRWIVRVTLRDNLRRVSLPLTTSFVLR